MRIYKYPIEKDRNQHGRFEIEMPKVIKFLDVKEQNGTPCIWALIDEETSLAKISFIVVETGAPVLKSWAHIGTFHQEPFVWHLFLT